MMRNVLLAVGVAIFLSSCAQEPPPPVRIPPHPAPVTAARQVVTPKGTIPVAAPVVKVALLVPLTGESLAIGNAMLDAATMAVYDSYVTASPARIRAQVVLIPKDTGNQPALAAQAAAQALDQGATFIIGPLFSQSVTAVAPVAKTHGVEMLTFSNNMAVAGKDVFVFGFLPEQQVARMADYAYLHGIARVAVLAPNDSYGQKIKDSLSASYVKKGGLVGPAELYAPSPANIDAAVARLVANYNNTPEDRRFQAIFIAEGGFQLQNIINALWKTPLDLSKIKLLGTGLWDDPEVMKIPEMYGAWFPSSPPDAYQAFEKRFVATYGYKPVRLASLAYDAVMLVSNLGMPTRSGINVQALTDQWGYTGPANGLYRLRPNGISERRLAVVEITPNGMRVIDPAAKEF